MTTNVRYSGLEAYRSLMPGDLPRPYVSVRLYHGGDHVDTVAIVDSGADFSLFNKDFAVLLKLDLSGVPRRTLAGIGTDMGGGGPPAASPIAQYVELDAAIKSQRFRDLVGFTTAVPPSFGLLGRHGFFRAASVGFDQRNQRLVYNFLTPIPLPPVPQLTGP